MSAVQRRPALVQCHRVFYGGWRSLSTGVRGPKKVHISGVWSFARFLAARSCCLIYLLLRMIHVRRNAGDCSRSWAMGVVKIAACVSAGS